MECYLIKFIGGGTLEITKDDFNNLMGKTGLVAIKSCGQIINTASISRILPKSQEYQLEDKKDQNTGVLHNGTPVIKHFGIWYEDGNFDENGKPWIRIDSAYYPEVRNNCVPSAKEYEKIKHLPKEERLKLIMGKMGESETPRLSNGFEKI